MSERSKAATCGRATGFVSAVLLVVLLATSGWPGESHALVDNTCVTSCEGSPAEVRRTVVGSGCVVVVPVAAVHRDLSRVLPRHRRVDSWGLPPPRAPTA